MSGAAETVAEQAAKIGGRYAPQRTLGRGAYGVVWECLDALTGQRVAVKRLALDEGPYSARVRREVAALRLLRIPGVVPLLDEGVDDEGPYLVMELVDGTRFPGTASREWRALAPVAEALLETLGRIHSAGVLHRDLKPANVLVNSSGAPVVLDFGLARAPIGDRITAPMELLGTPAYIAPECVRGGEPSPASDLFAFGVMLFEALTGELPFPSSTAMQAVYSRVLVPARPLRPLCADAPEAVVALVDALLRREPEDRPPSAARCLAMLRGDASGGADERTLPLLSARPAIDAVVESLSAGRAIDVVGASGVGRTRALREVAAAMRSRGREPLWIVAGKRPFSSLGAALGGLSLEGARSPRDALDGALAEIRARLAAGACLLVDDYERVDPMTRRALDELGEAVPVARALSPETRGATVAVALSALSREALEGLFVGTERLLHLRSDAARLLYARTGGVAARVAAELDEWLRRAVVERDGDRYRVQRDELDRFATAPRLRLTSASRDLDAPLSVAERDLLRAMSTAWPDASLDVLARALDRPVWEVEFDARSLEERRLVRECDGRFEALVDAWVEWSDAQLAAVHARVASALAPGSERRMMHMVASATSVDDGGAITSEALLVAERFARQGELGAAVALLDEAHRAVRRVDPEGVAGPDRLLRVWTEYALSQETPTACDRALYALCRAPTVPSAPMLEGLLRAALATSVDGARALSMTAAMGALDDRALERRRLAVRVLAARSRAGDEERAVMLDAVTRCEGSGDARDRAAALGWLGRLRYREGRFDEAAALQLRAAALEPWEGHRVVALARAASAHMEGFRLDEAERIAEETRALAARCRNAHYEALAEWVLRTVSYRAARVMDPDDELVAAAHELGARHLEALICMTEASVAWRRGDVARALARVEVSIAQWRALGLRENALLARSLAVHLGGACDGVELRDLVASAATCTTPGVGVQVLALLARRAPIEDRGVFSRLASQVDRAHWGRRIDVLSVEECLAMAGVHAIEVLSDEAQSGERESFLAPLTR